MIAPLDWGFGHAARCIPLISYLNKTGFTVFIASDGDQLSLLKNEFPDLTYIHLKGYRISYTKHKRWLWAKILWQIPKIIKSVTTEHKQAQKLAFDHKIDLIISDNRFGFYSRSCSNIFITHQLKIKMPFEWLESLVQKINYSYISHFSECWVPDFEGENNIAGLLSHPLKMPKIKLRYLGPLSRLSRTGLPTSIYKYLIVLSGPEPQRTIFEDAMKKIIPLLKDRILMVRAKPRENDEPTQSSSFIQKNHLTTSEMQQAFMQSEYIISRSGYTTVMELLSLEKKSILIPTPGQTEQEYLAARLYDQHWCYTCNQDDDLLYHILQAEKFDYKIPKAKKPVFEKAIDDFLLQFKN